MYRTSGAVLLSVIKDLDSTKINYLQLNNHPSIIIMSYGFTTLSPPRNLHKAAVLSLDIPQRDVLVSASYDKTVRELDIRTPVSIHSSHTQHTKPVLSLTTTDRYIYSASEDKTVCVWDRRGQGELQRVLVSGLYDVKYYIDDNLAGI